MYGSFCVYEKKILINYFVNFKKRVFIVFLNWKGILDNWVKYMYLLFVGVLW